MGYNHTTPMTFGSLVKEDDGNIINTKTSIHRTIMRKSTYKQRRSSSSSPLQVMIPRQLQGSKHLTASLITSHKPSNLSQYSTYTRSTHKSISRQLHNPYSPTRRPAAQTHLRQTPAHSNFLHYFSTSNKNPLRGSIELIMGPMFSGKSTELLREYRNSQEKGHKVALIKHAVDQRYQGQTEVVTHSNDRMQAYAVHELKDPAINDVLDRSSHIFIDEGQFFPDIDTSAEMLASKGKRVVVAALDGTFGKEPFPGIAKLIPRADRYRKILAKCHGCGDDAPFSKRLTDEDDIVVIGGADKYHAVCRSCYDK